MTPSRASWVTCALLASASCAWDIPIAGTPTLYVTATPQRIAWDGRETAAIVAEATDEWGQVGTGVVRFASTRGSLRSGLRAELDAFGQARATFTCDRALDPTCDADVRLTAEWERDGGIVATGAARVSLTAPVVVDAGPVDCPDVLPPCEAGDAGVAFQGYTNGAVVPWWRDAADPVATHDEVTSARVLLTRRMCSGTSCDRLDFEVRALTWDAGAAVTVQTWDGRAGDWTPVVFGGSLDVPTLRPGTYVGAVTQRMQPTKPLFGHYLCPTTSVSRYTVCRLDVVDGIPRDVLVTFESTCDGVPDAGVRGCLHYSQ